MKLSNWSLVFVLILSGCIAGGLLFDHSAPEKTVFDSETPIKLTVVAPGGDARSLSAQLHYRLSGSPEEIFSTTFMAKTKSDKQKAMFDYCIPPTGKRGTGKCLEMYFEITGTHDEDHSYYLKDTLLKIPVE